MTQSPLVSRFFIGDSEPAWKAYGVQGSCKLLQLLNSEGVSSYEIHYIARFWM